MILQLWMYQFAWVDQREKQGYKSDVSLKAGIHVFVSWDNIPLILTYSNLYKPCHSLYRHNKAIIDCGFKLVDIRKLNSCYLSSWISLLNVFCMPIIVLRNFSYKEETFKWVTRMALIYCNVVKRVLIQCKCAIVLIFTVKKWCYTLVYNPLYFTVVHMLYMKAVYARYTHM